MNFFYLSLAGSEAGSEPPDLHDVYILPLETGVLGRLLRKGFQLSGTGKEVHVVSGADAVSTPERLKVLLGPTFKGNFLEPSFFGDVGGLSDYANIMHPEASKIVRYPIYVPEKVSASAQTHVLCFFMS